MRRDRFQGMLTIARFNWPFYLAATLVLAVSIAGIFMFRESNMKAAMALAAMGSGYFVFVSLGVSHLIYDRSDLYKWSWTKRALRDAPCQHMIFCHSGFDEASVALAEQFGHTEWKVLDHYDSRIMTEASISRARALFPPTLGTIAAPFSNWPVANAWADVVWGILAIHELRSVEERHLWFSEATRCLTTQGTIVIVEHVRDAANFLAFGPGFLHFHSVKRWQQSWESAGLRLAEEFRVTPWVRVFVLKKP